MSQSSVLTVNAVAKVTTFCSQTSVSRAVKMTVGFQGADYRKLEGQLSMAALVVICGDSTNFVEFIELQARTVEFPTHQTLIFFLVDSNPERKSKEITTKVPRTQQITKKRR